MEQVTVDKSYFDALLRRADFHTSAQFLGRADPATVTISRDEHDSLLRSSREYQALKNALFDGGLTPDTLAQLISGAVDCEPRKDSMNSWDGIAEPHTIDNHLLTELADDFDGFPSPYKGHPTHHMAGATASQNGGQISSQAQAGANSNGRSNANDRHLTNAKLRVSGSRHVSYGVTASSLPDMDDTSSFMDDANTELPRGNESTLRTLYFCGFPARTTYRDLLSVVKGGKLLSISLRSERSATVTFLDAAQDYLTWTKRNDIYLNGKRVEVRWADRQFNLNNHISNKVSNGATRNLLIRSALDKGLTEAQIRDDMEHIHGLVIIDVSFRNAHAYVSTNSVHNALFARTCMMSRTTYKGCKIEFYPDECDVPLPVRAQAPNPVPQEPPKKNMPLGNRFDMLGIDGSESGEENIDPDDQIGESDDEDDDTVNISNIRSRHGVRLDFIDSESNV